MDATLGTTKHGGMMYDPKNPACCGSSVSLASMMAVLFFGTTLGLAGVVYWLHNTRPPFPSFNEESVVMVKESDQEYPAKILYRRLLEENHKFFWSYMALSPEQQGVTSFTEDLMRTATVDEALRYATSEIAYQKKMAGMWDDEVARVQRDRQLLQSLPDSLPTPAPVLLPPKNPEPTSPPEIESDKEVE